jgi:hypothetical protein
MAMANLNQTAWSPRRASLIAGISYLLLSVLAAFGNFGAIKALVTPGDAAKTAKDILGSESLFRVGIACLILAVMLDIVVALALRALFEPVNKSVSTMAAAFRVAYAAVFLVAISQLVGALALLDDASLALHAIDAFTTIFTIGLVLFGVHLMLIGHLVYRSGFAPRILGVLLAIAGLGYLVDGFGVVLVRDYSAIGQFTFVGEVALVIWLLVKGIRITTSQDSGQQPPAADPRNPNLALADETT